MLKPWFQKKKKSPKPQASVSNQRTITVQPGSMQTERNAASLQIQQRHPPRALVRLRLGKREEKRLDLVE